MVTLLINSIVNAVEKVQIVNETVEPLPDPERPVMLRDSVYVDALAFLACANEIIVRCAFIEKVIITIP